jgi:hypothetical protein
MEVEFSLTQADFVAFQEHLNAQPAARKWRRDSWIGVGVMLFVSAVFIASMALEFLPPIVSLKRVDLSIPAAGTLFCLWYVVSNLYGLLFWRRFVSKSVHASLQESGSALMLAMRRTRISAQGMCESTEFGTTTVLPWITILRVDVALEHVFLLVKESEAFIVPKRAFPTEADFNAFVDTAQRYHSQAGLQKFEGRATGTDKVIEGESPSHPAHPDSTPRAG